MTRQLSARRKSALGLASKKHHCTFLLTGFGCRRDEGGASFRCWHGWPLFCSRYELPLGACFRLFRGRQARPRERRDGKMPGCPWTATASSNSTTTAFMEGLYERGLPGRPLTGVNWPVPYLPLFPDDWVRSPITGSVLARYWPQQRGSVARECVPIS